MRDGQNSELSTKLLQGIANSGFAIRIQATGGFVQNQQFRFLHQGSRNRNTLPLPPGQFAAAFADDTLHRLRHAIDKLPGAGRTQGFLCIRCT